MAGPLTPEGATSLLRLIEAEPSLLPELERHEVTRWVVGVVDRRPEEHACLGCPAVAEVALVAEIERLGVHSYHWLDLCVPCAAAVRETDPPRR